MQLRRPRTSIVTRLVLASTSRYRRALLERLGLPFEAVAPIADETARPDEAPQSLAARLAEAKARSIAIDNALVVGSDQVASLDGSIPRKPMGFAKAFEQLRLCQGRQVDFHTAVFVVETEGERSWQYIDRTRVTFARRTDDELERYLHREAPYDCAGGFKAEGLGIALFSHIESDDPTGLIGLPLINVARILAEAGMDPLGADVTAR